jgi:2-polyprenyl-6-methoxyphenol hydroxylase-like FAD-dependent oxidoreductase
MKTQQHNSVYDVIISGAGPVGLFLACELALAKCSVLILEKAENPHSPLKRLPFGIRGLSAPTIEALDRRGFLKELDVPRRLTNPHSTTGQGPRRQAGHFAGIPFHDGDIDGSQWKYRLPTSTQTALISELEELETVLGHRAESLDVKIKRGVALTGFRQTGQQVTVQCGNVTVEGQWLVGCDGSRSVVRKLGGFEFTGTEPEFTGYSARVDIANPETLDPGRVATRNGMYLQSQPGYIVIQDFDAGAFHDSAKPITLERIQEVLRHVSNTDVTLTALHMATTWTDRARQATNYRNGRVLLAGDSAHIHSPLGGQGLNLGLGDAMNLGWKLAEAVHGNAPQGLLDSYHLERHPIGAQVLDWSRAQVALMRPDAGARALNTILRDLMDTRDGATYFAGKVRGIGTRYDLGADHPLVGQSVPNFELQDGLKIAELMHDGLGLILDFGPGMPLQPWADSSGLKYVAGPAKIGLGLAAALVRPDGVVAFATDTAPDLTVLADAAGRWFSN